MLLSDLYVSMFSTLNNRDCKVLSERSVLLFI